MGHVDGWRLGYRPALDGLRGFAVFLVVVSHLSEQTLRPLGWAGVVVFFVLSGFLITALLLEERGDRGRVSLRGFYLRRARRLVPALIAVVGVVALAVPRDVMVLGALTYSSNLLAMNGIGVTSPLAHTWSLAIEEQFYLAWPALLLALGRCSRRIQVGLLVAAIAGTWLHRVQVGSSDWNRVYFGTDVRADALLLGCLLAVLLHGRTVRAPLPTWATLGAAAVLLSAAYQHEWFLLVIMPGVVAVAAAAMVWVAATRDGGWLAWPPLHYLGRRSYGLYLWHWPILMLLRLLLRQPAWWVLAGVGVPVSLMVAEFSWRFIEAPFLCRARGPILTARARATP